MLRISYNTHDDKIEITEQLVENSTVSGHLGDQFVWWKDVAYIPDSSETPGQLQVMDLK